MPAAELAVRLKVVGGRLFVSELKDGEKATKNLGLSLTGLAKRALAVGGFVGLVGGLGESIKAASDAAKVNRLTAQAISATGGAAGMTATKVHTLAESLSVQTGIQAESIQAAENYMLRLRGVRDEAGAGHDVFTRATRDATDMAAAMGTDATSAARVLGKALQDPTTGMMALRRAGVSLTAAQKAQVKSLQAQGDMFGAQNIILGEVERRYRGAGAAGSTALGRMQAAIHNVEVTVGTALLPAVTQVAAAVGHFAEGLSGTREETTGFGKDLNDAGLAIRNIATALTTGKTSGDGFLGVLSHIAAVLGEATRWFVSHKAAIVAASIALGTFIALEKLGALLAAVREAKGWSNYIRQLRVVIGLTAVKNALDRAGEGGKWIQKQTVALMGYIAAQRVAIAQSKAGAVATAVWNAVTKAGTIISAAFGVVWNLAFGWVGLIVLAVAALAAGIYLLWTRSETFRKIVLGTWNAIKAVAAPVIDFIRAHWQLLLAILTSGTSVWVMFIIRHWRQIRDAFATAINFIRQHWQLLLVVFTSGLALPVVIIIRYWHQIRTVVETVVSYIRTAWSALATVIRVVWSALWFVARAIVYTALWAIVTFFTLVLWPPIRAVIGLLRAAWSAAMWLVRTSASLALAAVRLAWALILVPIRAVIAAVRAAWNFAMSMVRMEASAATSVIRAVWNAIRGPIAAVASFVRSVWSAAMSFARSVAAAAVSAVKSAWHTLVGAIASVVAGIRSAFSAVKGALTAPVNSAVSAIKSSFNTIKSAFRAVINWVIEKWNGLSFHVPATHIPGLGTVGGNRIGVVKIPKLAEGGTLRQAGVALVGERGPELVSLPGGATVAPLPAPAASGQPIVVQLVLPNNKILAETAVRGIAAIRART